MFDETQVENRSGGYLDISAEVFHALNVSCLSDICDPNLPASSNVLIEYFMGCQCVAAVSAVYKQWAKLGDFLFVQLGKWLDQGIL